jgi:hypothetical protein
VLVVVVVVAGACSWSVAAAAAAAVVAAAANLRAVLFLDVWEGTAKEKILLFVWELYIKASTASGLAVKP